QGWHELRGDQCRASRRSWSRRHGPGRSVGCAAVPELLAVAVPVAAMSTGPDAPRPVDEPMLAQRPDVRRWMADLDDRLRRDLQGRLLTQLLLGEPVELLAEDGDWAHVIARWQPSSRDDRGYPGWVRRGHLTAP